MSSGNQKTSDLKFNTNRHTGSTMAVRPTTWDFFEPRIQTSHFEHPIQ